MTSKLDSATLRAFLYARVSTDRKQDESKRRQEVENQLPEMRESVRRREWILKREYVDRVTGTGKRFRGQFEEMLEACERREADVVLIWSLDRFSREGTLRTMLLLDRLHRAGVKVMSMREPWLDPASPTYELLVAIFSWIAKQESLRLGERVRAGMEHARSNGAKFGRPVVVDDPARIHLLRSRRLSLRAIARLVHVSEGTVRRVLRSPASLRNKGC